jgi:hypothetical protein
LAAQVSKAAVIGGLQDYVLERIDSVQW